MSILDDAIREHLELKRAHGADEAELKRLEDEAFGPPGRPDEPDPFAEAPTEFMAAPEGEIEAPPEEAGRRRINVADLQEPPPEPKAPEAAEVHDAPPEAEVAPPVEDAPAQEHEVVREPEAAQEGEPAPEHGADTSHSTKERHAIAEQPTEFFDVESEMAETEEPAAAEAPSPSDEEIVEAELSEPKLAPAEPVAEDEEEDDFFSEQRLSDELHQALEAPVTDEHEALPPLREPDEEGEEDEEDDEGEVDYDPDTGHEDVLEDTPDFLEDAPEDDELWFEQRPPKDFDFDD